MSCLSNDDTCRIFGSGYNSSKKKKKLLNLFYFFLKMGKI